VKDAELMGESTRAAEERRRLRQRAAAYWLETFGIKDAKRVFGVSRARVHQLAQQAECHGSNTMPALPEWPPCYAELVPLCHGIIESTR
jgi:hypothetical protein